MKKVNLGFSALTKEQRDRAFKQSVAAADGNLYRVTTKAELDDLLTELEKMAGEQ